MDTISIDCKLLGPGHTPLAQPPYPGPLGLAIQAAFSAEAWQLWLERQTLLLNEHRLNPLDAKDRAMLVEAMADFFSIQRP